MQNISSSEPKRGDYLIQVYRKNGYGYLESIEAHREDYARKVYAELRQQYQGEEYGFLVVDRIASCYLDFEAEQKSDSPKTYNVFILSDAEADGARWVLDSYQAHGTLRAIERCARINARYRKGVYRIDLNDLAGTLVRKNY